MTLLTNINKDIQCEVCWSMVFAGDKRCIVHHDDGDRLCCILCGASAERLGWCISV